MNKLFLKLLVNRFGFVVKLLPQEYQPAGEAFLFSLTNSEVDSERPVPTEILPTLAIATLDAIYDGIPSDMTYPQAISILNTYKHPVLVQRHNYPSYSYTILDYKAHPHYYVLGGFTARPQGDGYWFIEDRYDWHFQDYWRVPDEVTTVIPEWILRKFCNRTNRGWYISEVDTLSKWSVPYWHRSIVRLSDYLDSTYFD
jgi:hypothetical protein